MQLPKSKLLRSIFIALCLAIGISKPALASSPHVIVQVKDENGVPIPGVNVKWVDVNQNTIYMPTTAASYQITDELGGQVTINSGEALFRSWDIPIENGGFPERSILGPQFDHDFNPGTPTVPQWLVTEAGQQSGRFGCGQNPHSFSVVAPAEMGLVCNTDGGDLRNQELTNRFTITCQKLIPSCPTPIRNISCDAANQTMTIGWDAPPDGADGYKVYFDRFPFDDIGAGDVLLSDLSNSLQRVQPVTFNTQYRVRVKSLRNANGTTYESPSCWADLICQEPCDAACREARRPTATLIGQLCPARPSAYYYDYSLSNVDTKGQPFKESRMMITFNLNAQTRPILNFLTNGQNNPSFSLWNEQGRTPQDGDYFGFYVKHFTHLPNNNTISTRIDDSTTIGQQTIGSLRQFLADNNLPTQHFFKANMTTTVGTNGEIFNSHIPANGRIDLSLTANNYCNGTITCNPETSTPPACVTDVDITSPEDVTIVPNAQNQITVTWTSAAPVGSRFEALLYSKDVFNSAAAAFLARENGTAPIGSVIYFENITTRSQVFDLDNIEGTNLAVAVRGETVSACSPGQTELNCSWGTERTLPPPGFTVTGRFYNSETCQAINPVSLTGRTVSLAGNPDISTTITGDSYSLTVPYTDLAHTLQLNLGPSPTDPFVCSPCNPSGKTCNRPDVTSTNNTNVHFYVHEELVFTESWWNVYGGHVYASGDIRSQLANPDGQDLFRFIKRAIGGEGDPLTAGLPLTYTGQFLIRGGISERANDNQLQVRNVNLNNLAVKPDYAYYVEKLKVPFQSGVLDTINSQADLGSGASLGNGVVVYHRDGSLNFNINQTWNIPNGQHRIVLVNGNLTFSGGNLASGNKLTTVAPGGTLTFIAKERIIINGNVGNVLHSSTEPNLEGIFIAKEIHVLGGEDRRFVGSGSFYGWQNVDLGRQYSDDDLNAQYPTETFIYRPDFVINLPDVLRETNINWKEVN